MAPGRTLVVALAVTLLAAGGGLAQRFGGRGGGFGGFGQEESGPRPTFPKEGEFHFVRTEYTDLPQYHRRFGFASRNAQGDGWWMVDWPDADDHFSLGIRRLTRIDTGEPHHFRLTDPQLFDHPWIYATQTGWWGLSDAECARLGEYLRRGGYLVVDDMWGPGADQWEVFRSTLERALPGHPIVDIAPTDQVMHVLYDIEEKDLTWIPGTRHLRRGYNGTIEVRQPEGTSPAWRSINDDHAHMVVAINYNTDVGDAWEYADSPIYPEAMTALAYRYGINYIVYAMTH
jgi:hypothetical protein